MNSIVSSVRWAAVFALAVTNVARASPRKPGQATKINYTLHVEKNDVRVLVTVNDVPIFDVRNTQRVSTFNEPVNEWLHPSATNTLRVRVEPDSSSTAADPHARVTLKEGKDKVLVTFEWPPPNGDVQRGADQRFPFPVAHPPPMQLWTKADALTLDAKTRGEIDAFARGYYRVLQRADIRGSMALEEFKIQEMIDSLYLNGTAYRQEILNFNQENMRSAGWTLPDLPASALSFELVGFGRAVLVTRNGEPFVFLRDFEGIKGQNIVAPLYVGRIAGKWAIVR